MPLGPGALSLSDLKKRKKSWGEGGRALLKSQEEWRERRKERALEGRGEGREKVPNQPTFNTSRTCDGFVATSFSSLSTAVTKFAGDVAFHNLESRSDASNFDEFMPLGAL